MMMLLDGWVSLGIAILFGVLGMIALKLSHGLQKLKPTLFLCLFYTISFIALTLAIKHIELSVVYTVWSGVGTLLVTTIGIIYLKESVSLRKIIFLSFIIVGVIGIHLSDSLS